MPELTMISPLLNGMTDPELWSSHEGTSVYRVRHESTGLYFIVKHISVPESAETTDILVEKGIIPAFNQASDYYKSIVEQYRKELVQFHTLSQAPNICSCLRFQVVQKADQPGFDMYLLSPYRTSLLDFLHDVTISRKTAIQIGIDLCNALIVLRQNGFIHQNVKPENIFLEKGKFVLSGFGLADVATLQHTAIAKPYIGCFSAPEAFSAGNCLNQTMDLYSIGLLLHYIYNGNYLPFANDNTSAETPVNRRISGEPLPAPSYADPALDALLRKACAFNIEDRFQTPEELLYALQSYQIQDKASNQCVVPQQSSVSAPQDVPPTPSAEEAVPQEAREHPAAPQSPEESSTDAPPPEKPKRNKRKLIAPLLSIAVLLAAVLAVAYLYFIHTAIPISDITIIDKGIDYITVGLEAEHASPLLVSCSTQDGTDLATYHADDTVTFQNLEPGTTYNIIVKSMDWHHVKGVTGGTATTTSITNVLQFDAVAGSNQSVDISLAVDGPAPEEWTILCTSNATEDTTYTLTGSSGTIAGLLANCEYTLTLDAGIGYHLLGTSSISFSYTRPINGTDLRVSAMDAESITVSWDADDETPTAWTVTCIDENNNQEKVITGERTATFTGLKSGTNYTFKVTNSTMSAPLSLTTDIVELETLTFDVSTVGTSATLTWDAKGYACPETWIVSYGLSSMIEPQTLEVTGMEAELPYLLPGCNYTFKLSSPDGTEIVGPQEVSVTTSTTQYGDVPMPSDITFSAAQTDDQIICTASAPSGDLPDGTVVMVTLTDTTGDILTCGRSTYDKEKDGNSVVVKLDTLPENAGSYGLSLYCNSQRLQSSVFAIQ